MPGPLGFRVEYLEASPVLLNAYVKWKKPTGEVEVMAYIISYFINGSNAAMVNVSYNTHFFITDLQPSSVVSDITVYATNKTGPCEPTTLSNKVNIMPSLCKKPMTQLAELHDQHIANTTHMPAHSICSNCS